MEEQPDIAFIKISGLENAFEAQLVDSILTEGGIPHRIRSFHDTAYDGLFQVQKGWGILLAPESYKESVQEILAAIRTQAQDPGISPMKEKNQR